MQIHGRRIRLFRNGDTYFPGKKIIISPIHHRLYEQVWKYGNSETADSGVEASDGGIVAKIHPCMVMKPWGIGYNPHICIIYYMQSRLFSQIEWCFVIYYI